MGQSALMEATNDTTRGLFAIAAQPLSAVEAEIAANEAAVVPQKTFGERYVEVFEQYKQALAVYVSSLGLIAAGEREFAGGEDYARVVKVQSNYTVHNLIKKVAQDIRHRLVWKAQEQFAPEGGRLEIDNHDLQEQFPIEVENSGRQSGDDLHHRIEFDPAACWAYLESKYGGDAGKELAWRQAAAALVNHFDLERKPELKVVAGRVVLNLRVWTEKKWNGKRELSYHSQEKAAQALKCLGAFANWASFDDMVFRIEQSPKWGYSSEIISRQRFDIGDGCSYVTFNDKWEFHLSRKVADQLQLFLGQFGKIEE